MAYEKAARRKKKRLWIVEVPCAVACQCRASTICLVCVCVCVFVGYHRDAFNWKNWKERRERGWYKSRMQSSHLEGSHLHSNYLDRSFCSLLLDRWRTGIHCCVSLKENIHYSSQERREHTNCYGVWVIPLRNYCGVAIQNYTMQTYEWSECKNRKDYCTAIGCVEK